MLRHLATAALTTAALTTTVLTTAAVLTPAGAAHAADPVHYVALGDSYTAGPLTSFLQPGAPIGCIRGDLNYPTLIAKKLKPASFEDVSCSGAKTTHMAGPQSFSVGRPNPPQLNALTTQTTLVTLTLGGNDMGFSKAMKCFQVAAQNPEGSPCKDQLTQDGTDPFEEGVTRSAPKVGEVLQAIRDRAPHARVLLLTYPLVLPQGPGCYPWVPIAAGDAPFLLGAELRLNAMLLDQAGRHEVEVVDTTEPGHDMCQGDPAKRWIEGVPLQWAAPAHPNQQGERAMAELTLKVLGVVRSESRSAS
ncbi:MAG: SGNH/GDSL hydrolase family protein [Streptosporangiaceae bacterium]